MIPDGRFSRVRFEAAAIQFSLQRAFLKPTRLTRGRHTLASLKFATPDSHQPGQRFYPVTPGPCLLNRWRCNTHRPFAREALPPHCRYYDLMCQSCCLPSTMHGDSLMNLCSLDHPLLVNRTFPTLSLRILLRMHGPLPRQSLRCNCPFLPAEHRPSPRYDRSAT